ncbi:hypothetical protein Tco_1162643 [Tanacetum coccineum]
MTEFETRVRRDTDKVYTRLDDEQFGRQLLAGQLNMLFRDRRAHPRTARLMETEARMSREAWGRSMDASDLAHVEDSDYRDVGGRSQEAEAAYRGTKADKRLQTQMTEFERHLLSIMGNSRLVWGGLTPSFWPGQNVSMACFPCIITTYLRFPSAAKSRSIRV